MMNTSIKHKAVNVYFLCMSNDYFFFRPNEDDTDNHSDEGSFLSSHTSDIGSPSSSLAPPTPTAISESDTFKRPFPIEQPHVQDDLIGSRTRSKLPLNDTPLEHLELAFIPPDISTDMYDSDCDNEEWRKFLKVCRIIILINTSFHISCIAGVCMPPFTSFY